MPVSSIFYDSEVRSVIGVFGTAKLSKNEAAFANLAASRIGEVVTIDDISNAIYGVDAPNTAPQVVRVLALKIRRKMDSVGSPYVISTKFGKGYVLSALEDNESNTINDERQDELFTDGANPSSFVDDAPSDVE